MTLIETGELREDLFYRLNVLAIKLPPLRERKEDIPLLVEHFWEKATNSAIFASLEEKSEVLRVLVSYDWSGNVRELENEIYRIASIGDDTLNVRCLSKHILNGPVAGPISGNDMRTSISNMEKSLIETALKEAKGSKSQAARIPRHPQNHSSSQNQEIRDFPPRKVTLINCS